MSPVVGDAWGLRTCENRELMLDVRPIDVHRGANRVIGRAQARARHRDADAAEPIDLLAALASETEGHAATLLAEFGLPPGRLAELLGVDELEEWPVDDLMEPSPLSAAMRVVVGESLSFAKELDRARQVGTEHLLSGLLERGVVDR